MIRLTCSLLIASVLSVSAAHASANNIGSPHADLFIKVTKDRDYRAFELCSRSGSHPCRQIGHRPWYTVPALKHQRKIEIEEAIGSTFLTTVITGLALFGTVAVVTFALPETVSDLLFFASQATALGVVGTKAFKYVTQAPSGPVNQWKQQYVIRPATINGDDIILDDARDAEIVAIATRLDTVLRKIL